MATAFTVRELDPQGNIGVPEFAVLSHVYDRLVDRDDGARFKPMLAQKWETSPDGLRQSFTLRRGVKWHDETDFTAEDVKATIERVKQLKTGSRWSLYGPLARVEAPDPYTAVFVSSTPFPALVSHLTTEQIFQAKAYRADPKKFFEQPIGTGPYRLTEYRRGQMVSFEAAPSYWQPGVARVERVSYRSVAELTTRVAALRAGEIHIADQLEAEQVAELERDRDLSIAKVQGLDTTHLALGCDRPPFDNVKLRQAVNFAVDRAALARNVMRAATPIATPFAEGLFGHHSGLRVPERDVARAKRLIAEAGYDGSKIAFIVPNSGFPKVKEVTQAIAAQLREAGFNVDLQQLDQAGWTNARNAKKYHITFMSAVAPVDPDWFYSTRIRTDNFGTGYANPRVNEMLDRAAATADPKQREALYRDIQEILYQESPQVFLYALDFIWGVSKKVIGFLPRNDWQTRFLGVGLA